MTLGLRNTPIDKHKKTVKDFKYSMTLESEMRRTCKYTKNNIKIKYKRIFPQSNSNLEIQRERLI